MMGRNEMAKTPAVQVAPEFNVRSLGTVYRFWIVGLTPLMTHNPASMRRSTEIKKGKRSIPEPEEEAAAGCYRLPAGELCVPAAMFREATIRAARDFDVPGKKVGRRAAVLSDFLGTVMTTQELLVLVDPTTKKPVKDYKIDTRRVVVQGQGVLRSRPQFWPWACTLELVADPKLIAGERTGDLLLQALQHAGAVIGIGEYRPSRGGGIYGRFKAELILHKEG